MKNMAALTLKTVSKFCSRRVFWSWNFFIVRQKQKFIVKKLVEKPSETKSQRLDSPLVCKQEVGRGFGKDSYLCMCECVAILLCVHDRLTVDLHKPKYKEGLYS
jgi:hypothetical protein